MLIAQDGVRIEHFVRQTVTMWTMTEYTSLGAAIGLPSLGVALPVNAIYEELDFSEEYDIENDE